MAADDVELGVRVHVVRDGANGFTATVALDPADAVQLVASAADAASLSSTAVLERVELADEPSHGDVEWTSPHRIDPTTITLADKVAVLGTGAGASSTARRSITWWPPSWRWPRIATTPTPRAPTLTSSGSGSIRRWNRSPSGRRATSSRCGPWRPPVGKGWEYVEGDGWDWNAELEEMPDLLEEKVSGPTVTPGRYDLVIDPTNLWPTIHESIGHATELDRALGFEAAYAGTSFATPDQLGSLRYGSDHLRT